MGKIDTKKGKIDTKGVRLTQNVQDWHKSGSIDTKGAWLTKKVQYLHKEVGLTPNVQDWRKTYSIDIKRVKLAQKGHKWQKWCKIDKKGRIDTKCADCKKRVGLTPKVQG